MFFTHQAFYQDDIRNRSSHTWFNPSNGVAGIGYHRVSAWTRNYFELSLLQLTHKDAVAGTARNKTKNHFWRKFDKKRIQSLHIFTRSLVYAVKWFVTGTNDCQKFVSVQKSFHILRYPITKRAWMLFQWKLSFTTTVTSNFDAFCSSFRTYEDCVAIVHCSLATPDTKQYRYIDIFSKLHYNTIFWSIDSK